MPSVDLDRATDQLYAAPREDFIAVRKRLAKQARAAGQSAVAAAIEKLAKPTSAAWLANQLARSDGESVHELVELGQQMRDATERMAGDELRTLSQRRPMLIRELLRRAERASGQRLSDAVGRELEEILTAAVTDSGTGAALLAGRLTSAREAAPLGAWPDVLPGIARAHEPEPAESGSHAKAQPPDRKSARLAAAPGPARADTPDADADEPPARGESEAVGTAARDAEPREQTADPAAAEALRKARAAVKNAEAARGDSERLLQEAEAEAESAGAEVLRLTEQLDAAETREREARKRVVAARRAVKESERTASQAWRDVQLAEHRVGEGGPGGGR